MTKAPNSALRHAFGMKDPLLGRNEHERSLLETIHNVKTSHEKVAQLSLIPSTPLF